LCFCVKVLEISRHLAEHSSDDKFGVWKQKKAFEGLRVEAAIVLQIKDVSISRGAVVNWRKIYKYCCDSLSALTCYCFFLFGLPKLFIESLAFVCNF
jgi:hypothetical protein